MPRLSIAPPLPVDTYVDEERRRGLAEARELLDSGRPGYAFFKLARSVERQNRLAGNGTIAVPACPSCGARCRGGVR